MKQIFSILVVLHFAYGVALYASEPDWLIDPAPYTSEIKHREDRRAIDLDNGLVRRSFILQPNAATVSLKHRITGEEFVRSIRPEAVVEIDGMKFNIGGLLGQPVHNYLLPEWIDNMETDPQSFRYVGHSVGKTQERFPWKKRLDWMAQDLPWPPPGKSLTLRFKADEQTMNALLSAKDGESDHKLIVENKAGRLEYLKKINIDVHYEIYDGLPLIAKWLTIHNKADTVITIDRFINEILAVVEPESPVGVLPKWRLPNLTVETDYAFGGGMSSTSSLGKSVFWNTDPLYATQVNYRRQTPCLLECKPQYGPAQVLAPGDSLESFRVFELLHDSWERERKGLAQRRMYRTIVPWVTENPILMHVRQSDDESIKRAIDQCAEVGFEMVILTFGSGFNIEDESADNLQRLKKWADYAHERNIALGGYSLLASRRVGGGNDVEMPPGQTPRFGNSPCLESEWGKDYFRKLYQFFEKTGMDILEHDGSYPGDICISKDHPGHKGLEDSQWNQFVKIRDFYRWCREKGIYLNVPDWYFLNGSNKTGMGYRETNWSLPRKQQEIIERQNIFDGTWEKTPSMGWMFVPLTQYHGGGTAATIEPLHEHLDHYGQRLANLFGAGVQACYRGPRLYDTDETRALVKKWVDFYKKHRKILDSDIIHVRRPDGRDLDCILHVNPNLETKGLAMVYNPTAKTISKALTLPLYYTGLRDQAHISIMDGENILYELNREYRVIVPIDVKAHSQIWIKIKN